MAQGHQIELDPTVMEKLNAFATERNAAPAAIANEAIEEGPIGGDGRALVLGRATGWRERRARLGGT